MEQQLGEVRSQAEEASKAAASNAALLEQHQKEKSATEKELQKKLTSKEKELSGRVKDTEQRLKEADETSGWQHD